MVPRNPYALLHQRYPFMMVDHILDLQYGKYAVASKNVSSNEPWTAGHFPDEALFPGVLMIETMAQVSSLVFVEPDTAEKRPKMVLCAVRQIKIARRVVPGDVLVVRAELTDSIHPFHTLACTGKVGDKVVVTGSITLADTLDGRD